jgi:hypothetical protein
MSGECKLWPDLRMINTTSTKLVHPENFHAITTVSISKSIEQHHVNVFAQHGHLDSPRFMENGSEDNAAELAAEVQNLVSDLMMRPDREQVASEIGGTIFVL